MVEVVMLGGGGQGHHQHAQNIMVKWHGHGENAE